MHSARARRAAALGATTAAALLAVGATALPAQAAALQVAMKPQSTFRLLPTAGATSALNLGLTTTGTGTVQNAKLVLDTTALAGLADLVPDSHCSAQARVVTCDIPHAPDGSLNFGGPVFATAAGATVGRTATLHLALTSDNAGSAAADVTVTVGSPALVVKDLDRTTHAKPGDSLAPVFEVANVGQLPADRIVLEISAAHGLTLDRRASNCEYADIKAVVDTVPSGSLNAVQPPSTDAICTIDTVLAPGEVYRIDPLRLGVTEDAYQTGVSMQVDDSEDAGAPWRSFYGFVRGTGPGLSAVPADDPALLTVPKDNGGYVSQGISVDNTADLAVQGGWAPQAGGKQGTLTVRFRNNGPASPVFGGHTNVVDVRIQLPQGTATTGALPRGCRPVDPAKPLDLECRTTYMLLTGTQLSYDFPLSVDDPSADRNATIDLVSEEQGHVPVTYAFDPNPANNTATVALGARSATLPSAAAQAAASTTAPTEDSTNPADTGDADSGKALAFTGGGSDAAPLAAIGGGALLVGAGSVFWALRRRRAAEQD